MARKNIARMIFVLVIALAAPIAGHADTSGFDLTLTQVESRDPVPAGGIVTYTIAVFNNGANPANPFAAHVTVSPGTITGVAGYKWYCTYTATTADCTHEGARPSGRAARDLVVTVTAPSVNQGPIFETATISSPGESVTTNNTVSENTAIIGAGSYAAYIPPEGGTISTGSEATAADPFFGTLTFPAGPGGIARLAEHPERLPECVVLPCVGDTLEVIVPNGYDTPSNPIVVNMFYDVTIAPAGRSIAQLVIKPENGDTTPDSVPPCNVAGVAFPTPCVDSETTIAGGDRRVKILMLSGDPWYQGVEAPIPTS